MHARDCRGAAAAFAKAPSYRKAERSLKYCLAPKAVCGRERERVLSFLGGFFLSVFSLLFIYLFLCCGAVKREALSLIPYFFIPSSLVRSSQRHCKNRLISAGCSLRSPARNVGTASSVPGWRPVWQVRVPIRGRPQTVSGDEATPCSTSSPLIPRSTSGKRH